jgi:hypothetical protein
MGNFLKSRRLAPTTGNQYGVAIPAGTSATRPDGAPFGMIRYNTDSGFCEFFNGALWQPFGTGGVVNYSVQNFVGDGTATDFGPLTVTPSGVDQFQVFVGSIYQIPTTNYILTNLNTTIRFLSAPPNGISITLIFTQN